MRRQRDDPLWRKRKGHLPPHFIRKPHARAVRNQWPADDEDKNEKKI